MNNYFPQQKDIFSESNLANIIFGGNQLDSGQNQSLPSNWSSVGNTTPGTTAGGWSSNPADWVSPTTTPATTGWTSTGGGYTGGGYTGTMPTGLGGTPDPSGGGGGFAGLLDTFADIGSSLSGLFGGLGFGGGLTPGINPYSAPVPSGGGYQQTSNQTPNVPAPPPPAQVPVQQQQQQQPAVTTEKPKFFSVEEGDNWFFNKLVIAGKFKIPYWFGILLVAVAFWKREQIMKVFKKK